MGLNDLTIEKLITEINGYKEKMRTIHEEYGRASSDLQDRINVLGYTLNEHLKQTKDQMATTPQRLLNLEMKFVTGDVNESEYRTQRTEFKGLLENNLKSIEEIKLMIDTLSHIETKPLFPGEFKQTYPENKPAAVSWVGIGAIAQAKPLSPSQPQWPAVQSPAQSVLSTPGNVVEANPEPTSPAPAIPGPEAVPGIQGSPDRASVGLAPPSQFYKVVCPKCGADVPKPAKVWELKGGKSKKNVLIGLFQCQDCRVKFREALTREIL